MKEKIKYLLGGSLVAIVLMLGSAFLVYPVAVSQIVGLATTTNAAGTSWNNVKDIVIQTDGATSGSFTSGLMGYNGATWDRIRGTVTNGLAVDVTRISGTTAPADAFANPGTANTMWDLLGLFNGSTWDRARSISATNNTATTSLGAQQVVPLSTWSVINTTAASATAATVSKAAGGGTVRHVATGLTICNFDTVADNTSRLAHLRDGASGAGTILRTFMMSVPAANNSRCEHVTGLNITGSANTAMTIEFAGAPAGATQSQTVSLTGYSTP